MLTRRQEKPRFPHFSLPSNKRVERFIYFINKMRLHQSKLETKRDMESKAVFFQSINITFWHLGYVDKTNGFIRYNILPIKLLLWQHLIKWKEQQNVKTTVVKCCGFECRTEQASIHWLIPERDASKRVTMADVIPGIWSLRSHQPPVSCQRAWLEKPPFLLRYSFFFNIKKFL